MENSGAKQYETASDAAAEAARLFGVRQASGMTAVGGASGEITHRRLLKKTNRTLLQVQIRAQLPA